MLQKKTLNNNKKMHKTDVTKRSFKITTKECKKNCSNGKNIWESIKTIAKRIVSSVERGTLNKKEKCWKNFDIVAKEHEKKLLNNYKIAGNEYLQNNIRRKSVSTKKRKSF